MALLAIFNPRPHGRQTLGQRFGLFFVAFEQVQHQPEGGFLADTRQFGHLIDRVFDEFGWVLQEDND